ncbi:hypothetical protein [Amycolatopsis kentuckyensis]|uniref:hypothetical protein n=1 Tax=Amycolatopsis kentuckyensis TaxID=218823 RepID=UPI001FC91E48|nr:hypothetical protein [Amycolatopsis kentuckyensis]
MAAADPRRPLWTSAVFGAAIVLAMLRRQHRAVLAAASLVTLTISSTEVLRERSLHPGNVVPLRAHS